MAKMQNRWKWTNNQRIKVTVSQSRLQDTKTMEKPKPNTQIRLRKLRTEKTLVAYRIGATVSLKLAPEMNWRG